MSTAIERLAEIRAMGGHDPLPDPTKIQGDPVQHPLGPPIEDRRFDPDLPRDWIDPELDEGKVDPVMLPPPSPLIPQKPAPPGAVPNPIQGLLEQGLVVIGRLGAWKGREVQLSEKDEHTIRQVVLLAIRREVDADLGAVAARRPRRPRMPQVATEAEAGTQNPAPAPKRRGRPRGSLLNLS